MKLKMSLLAKAITVVALAAGAATPAFAEAQLFTINPGAIGAPDAAFSATQIIGSSSELLHKNATGNSGSGWLNIGSFALNGVAVPQTGIAQNYQLYITFQLADTYRPGTGTGINTANSINDIDTLTFQFYADTHFNNTFTQADAGSATEAMVSGQGDDILLATGSLINGVTGINEGNGAHLNSSQTFNTTAIGQLFFASPNPFYNIVFDEFNNTSQGVEQTDELIAINQASGSIDFNGNPVPEPATLGLMGLGMMGLAFAKRRRAK